MSYYNVKPNTPVFADVLGEEKENATSEVNFDFTDDLYNELKSKIFK